MRKAARTPESPRDWGIPPLGLFAGIEAPEGDGAMVLALSTLLCRLDEIERRDLPDAPRTDGTTTSSDGAAVLETLTRRGLDQRERERLGACVDAAKAASAPRGEGPAHDPRENELVALYRWHADWAATARTVIARKDLLVLMRLAGRRRGRVTDDGQRKENGGAGEG